jgi:hypothetical protein
MKRQFFRSGPLDQMPTEKLRGFCAAALVVSSEKIQSLVVGLPNDQRGAGRFGRSEEKFPAKTSFLLYNPPGLAHNLCFQYAN